MIYGYERTIHGTQHVNVETDKNGRVVSVWFRCSMLPFDQTVVDNDRAQAMQDASERVNSKFKLNAIDMDIEE